MGKKFGAGAGYEFFDKLEPEPPKIDRLRNTCISQNPLMRSLDTGTGSWVTRSLCYFCYQVIS
jgi:hypothetical protein